MPSDKITEFGAALAAGIDAAISAHDAVTRRAINYSITSSARDVSSEAHTALALIAQCLGELVVTTFPGDHGAAGHWRVIAAVALQMEARASGLDYSLPVADKPLTPD